jgi:multiple sugar transport system substrate-binding protein
MKLRLSSKDGSRRQRKSAYVVVSGLALSMGMIVTGGISSAAPRPAAIHHANAGPLVVWVDATRKPMLQAYMKAHPGQKISMVIFDADANGSGTMQTKVSLFNRTGHGWPDVIFSAEQNDVTSLADPTFHYAGALNSLIPTSVLNNFAKGSLAPCYIGTTLYCLRNDLAFDVLWYNAPAMKLFGYKVPTTWQQWQAIGENVAKNHPGYIIGSLGNSYDDSVYLQAAGCPINQLLTPTKLLDNPSSPNCTRMANLLNPLAKDGSVPAVSGGVFGSSFDQKYSARVLMMVGPAWYGGSIFAPSSALNIPKGQMAAAPPLQWAGSSQKLTGDVGGGLWIISSHTTQPKAAAALVTWMATNSASQFLSPGYPAYKPVASKWIAKEDASGYYVNPLAPVFAQAAGEVWPGWSQTRYDVYGIWNSTVSPGLLEGKSVSSLIPGFAASIKNYAMTDGYTVVSHP